MLQKVVDKLEKAGDVVQSKLEAAGHYLESEWNKHNFGPVLVVAHFYNSIKCLFVIGAWVQPYHRCFFVNVTDTSDCFRGTCHVHSIKQTMFAFVGKTKLFNATNWLMNVTIC